jgi:hypothetical protein
MFATVQPGSFTTVQHGEYTLTYIRVSSAVASVPCGAYFVPSCLSTEQRRKLLGRLDQRGPVVQLLFTEVNPRDLSSFLTRVGVSNATCANVARACKAGGSVTVPLLTKLALDRVKEGLPWPQAFPIPPPGIQIPPLAAPVAAPAPHVAPAVGVRDLPAPAPHLCQTFGCHYGRALTAPGQLGRTGDAPGMGFSMVAGWVASQPMTTSHRRTVAAAGLLP